MSMGNRMRNIWPNIDQYFLTEVYPDRTRAIATFERLIRHSKCRYLVYIDNRYDQVKDLMKETSGHLYDRGRLAATQIQGPLSPHGS